MADLGEPALSAELVEASKGPWSRERAAPEIEPLGASALVQDAGKTWRVVSFTRGLTCWVIAILSSPRFWGTGLP
jgi:hypothetical protein